MPWYIAFMIQSSDKWRKESMILFHIFVYSSILIQLFVVFFTSKVKYLKTGNVNFGSILWKYTCSVAEILSAPKWLSVHLNFFFYSYDLIDFWKHVTHAFDAMCDFCNLNY